MPGASQSGSAIDLDAPQTQSAEIAPAIVPTAIEMPAGCTQLTNKGRGFGCAASC
jgi:hypothetical protein